MRELEQLEKFKDAYYDGYYTMLACNHMNHIMTHYNREPQHDSFVDSLKKFKKVGLFEPCADNILYLKRLHHISKQ